MIRRAFRGVTAIQVISLVVFAALVASVLGVGYLLLQDRDRVVNNNDRLIEIYDDLYRQSQAEGIEPTTPEPGSVKEESQGGSIAGPRGATGNTGSIGATGPRGPQGEMGMRGQAGPVGETGAAGSNGAAGKDGASGARGPVGDSGTQGVPGLTGPQGATGEAGPAGSQGAPGEVGATGATGATGNGIADIYCDGMSLVIVYTDSTTDSVMLPGGCIPVG